MFAGKQSLNCVQSEVHNVLSALRRSGRFASRDRFAREIPLQFETPLIRAFKQLHDLLPMFSSVHEIDCVAVLDPFLQAIQSPNTDARVTARALVSINKFVLYGAVTQNAPRARYAANLAVEKICECQFESIAAMADELVLIQLLEVLVNLFRSEVGQFISDTNAWKVVETCWQLRIDKSSSTLLKSTASNSLTHVVLTIFTRAPELISVEALTHSSTLEALKSVDDTGVLPKSYGLPVIQKILVFLSNLTDVSKTSAATRAFGLQTINIVLETASTSLSTTPADGRSPIISILQGNLCKNLLQNSQSDDLTILSLTLRVVFNLFNAMKGHLKVQLEIFLISVHLRIAESTVNGKRKNEFKELALESLLDFCREPMMMLDLYINYDCDFNCTNLFETVTKALCKAAVPNISTTSQPESKDFQHNKTTGLNSLNLVALQGILAIIDQLSNFDNISSLIEEEEQSEQYNDDSISQKLKEKKVMKRKLQMCAKEFNKKPLKTYWITLAQEMGILPAGRDPTADEVAIFLLKTPGLDTEAVGEFLGDGPKEEKPLSHETMKAFMRMMNLRGMRIDNAIRKVLKEFRLPGEAQKIDRIMEAFGNELFTQNIQEESEKPIVRTDSEENSSTALKDVLNGSKATPSSPDNPGNDKPEHVFNVFKNADSAFTLAFSIIMLHTDLHNTAIKPEKKMTLEQFIRNNRGINDGTDFPPELLSSIYEKTKKEQMKMLYSPVDLSQSSSSEIVWDNVIKHSQNVDKAIFTGVSGRSYIKYKDLMIDMLNIIFQSFLDVMITVYQQTRDGKMVFKLLTGFQNLASVAYILQMNEKVDKIMENLNSFFASLAPSLERINLDTVSEEEEAGLKLMKRTKFDVKLLDLSPNSKHSSNMIKLEAYGSTHLCKCLLLFNCCVTISRSCADLMSTSWKGIINSIILVNDQGLLPNFFVELDDIIDFNRKKRRVSTAPESGDGSMSRVNSAQNLNFSRRNSAAIEIPRNTSGEDINAPTFWGLVTSFLFADGDTSSMHRNEEAAENIKDLISVWDVRNIFVSSRDLKTESLLKLVVALSDVRSISNQNVILCLELLTEVSNSISGCVPTLVIPVLKRIFLGFYRTFRLAGVTSSELNPSKLIQADETFETIEVNTNGIDMIILERLVIDLLGISMRMLSSDKEIQDLVIYGLHWIALCPVQAADRLAKKVGMGLGTVLTLNFMQLDSHAALPNLFNIMKSYSQFDKAVDHIYNSLAQVIIKSSLITDFSDMQARYDCCLSFVAFFILPRSQAESSGYKLPAPPLMMLSLSLFSQLKFNYDYQDMFHSHPSSREGKVMDPLSPKSLASFDSFGIDSDTEGRAPDNEGKNHRNEDEVTSRRKKSQERLLWSDIRAAKSLELVMELLLKYYSAAAKIKPEAAGPEYLIRILAFLKRFYDDKRELVRKGVRKALEIILMRFTNREDSLYTAGEGDEIAEESYLTTMDAQTWSNLFTHVLIPMVDNVDADQIKTYPFLAENLFAHSKLLSNCFLQRLNLLSTDPDFSLLWLKMVTVLCKNIKISMHFGSGGVVPKELCDKMYFTSVESLKNLLMVLSMELKWQEAGDSNSNLLNLTFDLIKTTSEEVKNEVAIALDSCKTVEPEADSPTEDTHALPSSTLPPVPVVEKVEIVSNATGVI